MNGYRPALEIEFENNYTEAKKKLYDFMSALNKLTPAQGQQLAREFIASTGMAASLEQFINTMNHGGQL